jgi:hypothetical protein
VPQNTTFSQAAECLAGDAVAFLCIVVSIKCVNDRTRARTAARSGSSNVNLRFRSLPLPEAGVPPVLCLFQSRIGPIMPMAGPSPRGSTGWRCSGGKACTGGRGCYCRCAVRRRPTLLLSSKRTTSVELCGLVACGSADPTSLTFLLP